MANAANPAGPPAGPQLPDVLQRLSGALDRIGGFEPLGSSIPFTLHQLLGVLTKHKGQFLHLNSGVPPTLRIEGELVPIGEKPLSPGECRNLVLSALTPDQRDAVFQGHELDFVHSEGKEGFRFHVFCERGCPSLSARRIRTDIPELIQLNLGGGAVERFLNEQAGLMILAGQPRCGKINTFAALISYINQRRRARIITVEPVIQFWHQNHQSTVIQRELGSDTHSFERAVRQVLNQDPDILAVGGIPDRETAEVVVQAAAGGHQVIALLDAVSVVRALDDLVSAFYGTDGRFQQMLARSVQLVVCQHLVTRADGRGQIPAFEILQPSPDVRQAIATGQSNSIFSHMRDEGQQTLARHLSRLVEVGLVSYEEAVQHVDPAELEVAPAGHDPYAQAPAPQPSVDDSTPLMSWL